MLLFTEKYIFINISHLSMQKYAYFLLTMKKQEELEVPLRKGEVDAL